MIICKNSLDLILHNTDKKLLPGCDLTVISIEISKQCSERLVTSFYKHPNVKFGYRQWRILFEEISSISNSSRIIILGDFNAHNESWGSSRNNFSEVFLNRFLVDSPFFFLNNGSNTRISAANYKSVMT